MHNGDKQEPTFGLDIQVFMDVIACGDGPRRTSLALQIARFLADPASPAGEREQLLPTARRLAADPDIAVRRAFAEALMAIGLFQALTSVQEMTLTFVPKVLAILITFWVSMSAMTSLLVDFFRVQVIPVVAGG